MSEDTHPDVKAAGRMVADARSKGELPPAYLDFRLEVLKLTRTPPARKGEPFPDPGTDEEIESMMREGVPLVSPGDVPADSGTFKETLDTIARLMKEAGVKGGAELAGALGREKDGPDPASLASAVLARDTRALRMAGEKIGISHSLLRFAVAQALYPLLSPAAGAFKDRVRQDLWMRGYCPVCGGEPDMGKLVREPPGARLLHCPACGTHWRFPRITCPFCGNDDHSKMQVLSPDRDSPLRVEACVKCKRYMKEMDERKLIEGTEVNLAAEELVTLHLDLGAEEEGYSN